MKCAEERPNCARCTKAGRHCEYAYENGSRPKSTAPFQGEVEAIDEDSAETRNEPVPSKSQQRSALGQRFSTTEEVPGILIQQGLDIGIEFPESSSGNDGLGVPGSANTFAVDSSLVCSPVASFWADTSSDAFMSAVSPGSAPFQWYDLLAKDAVNYFENNSSLNQDVAWHFDLRCLSRRPSVHDISQQPSTSIPEHISNDEPGPRLHIRRFQSESEAGESHILDAWNLADPVVLQGEDLRYFKHYVQEVAPILDLFDPSKHFGNIVPHMALRNVGLMKALLAVAARHLSLTPLRHSTDTPSQHTPHQTLHGNGKDHAYLAIQYFYETLKYLAAAMQIPRYTRSSEILATAVMINTYEMFDDSSQEWERHLRGTFWIQRNQDNDGESRGLQEAVWWAWVRQDILAAFRSGRRTLTIWRPKKPLALLTADELATRAVYLLAKAVSYASKEAMRTQDLSKRLEDGGALLQALDNWFHVLPPAYKPIPLARQGEELFEPIWVHPPAYAAALQSYYFAKIIIILNKPSEGGVSAYHRRTSTLQEASKAICGLAQAPMSTDPASAFVNFPCLFAGMFCSVCKLVRCRINRLAGQSLQEPDKQAALIKILEQATNACGFAPKTLIDDLRNVWNEMVPGMT